MKKAKLLHNPNAGGGEFTRKKLVKLIQTAGYACSYSSTKKEGWENIESAETDIVVLAGGDGTVRKVAGELLDKKIPIGLIPLGTANNIGKTLGITGAASDIVESWERNYLKKFDVGRIYGMKKAHFFLEGLGFGVFPRLMKEMTKNKKRLTESPEENLKLALELLHDIILTSKARYCKISVDGDDHSGKFLLAEVMNTQSIGPNLDLASFADPGDGMLEVILISERQREEFAAYVHNKLHGIDQAPMFNVIRAKNLDIFWEGRLLHVDDEIIELKKSKDIRIKLQEGVLQFYVPEKPEEKRDETKEVVEEALPV